MDIKNEIVSLLEKTNREGMNHLTAWLNESDFFTSPASTKFHGNFIGGLAEHSINVYDSLVMLNKEYRDKEQQYTEDTITIVALLHDLCKVNTYIEDSEPATEAQLKFLWDLINKSGNTEPVPSKDILTKAYTTKLIDYYKNNGDQYPEFTRLWKVKDTLPLGHGEKSLFLIQKFIQLTDIEALAIRWHLGQSDVATHFNFPAGYAYNQSMEINPLTALLHAADYLTTWFVDKRIK